MTTKADKEEIRELITDILNVQNERIEGKYAVIYSKLEDIINQTTKTNGRVNKLEDKLLELQKNQIEHTVNCPLESRIRELEISENLKKGGYKYLTIVAGVSAAIATIVISIAAIIYK